MRRSYGIPFNVVPDRYRKANKTRLKAVGDSLFYTAVVLRYPSRASTRRSSCTLAFVGSRHVPARYSPYDVFPFASADHGHFFG